MPKKLETDNVTVLRVDVGGDQQFNFGDNEFNMFQVHMTEGSWNCNLLKLRRDAGAWENFRSRCTDLKTKAWGNVSPPREKLYTEKSKEPK